MADKKAIAAIQAELLPGEKVLVTIDGAFGQTIFGTDRRAFVWKSGMMAGVTFGQKLSSWDYRNISGVHMDKGLGTGVIVIQAPGIDSAGIKYQSRNDQQSALKVPHAIPILNSKSATLQDDVARLRRYISEAQRPAATLGPAAPPKPSVASGALDELRKLGELRDAGVLTQAEFDQAKTQILSRL